MSRRARAASCGIPEDKGIRAARNIDEIMHVIKKEVETIQKSFELYSNAKKDEIGRITLDSV